MGLYFHGAVTSYQEVAMGKPRGLRTARKHVTHRREQRWHDKEYKKAHLGTRWKANPFEELPMPRELFLRKLVLKPNSPTLLFVSCVRVQLIKNGKKITAFVPND